MFLTTGQGYIFLVCAALGAILGAVYELCFLVRFCGKKGAIVTIVTDIIFAAAVLFCTVGGFYKFRLEFRLYVFLGFAVGFFLERFSLGFFIAKSADLVYNIFCRIKERLKKSRLKSFLKRVFR